MSAQDFLLSLVNSIYPEPSDLLADLNPKGALQEFTQQHFDATPEYLTVEVSGPDHNPSYTVEVLIKGKSMGKGSAAKRKAAESAAAKVALDNLLSLQSQTSGEEAPKAT